MAVVFFEEITTGVTHQMKDLKLFLTLLIFIVGCSEQNTIVDNPQDYVVVPYNNPNDNKFISKEIKFSDFVGHWKLLNAKYQYALGELNHIENNYNFTENEKTMIYSDSSFKKICFWGNPEYVNGVILFPDSQNIKIFYWSAANVSPSFLVKVNYSDSLLTLYYPSVLFMNSKYFEGRVYETYKKR